MINKGTYKNIGHLTSRLRYPIALSLVLLILLFLSIRVFPTFDNAPDDKRFFTIQEPVIYIYNNNNELTNKINNKFDKDMSKNTITIFNNSQKFVLSSNKKQSQEINFDSDIEFRFASKSKNKDNFAIIERSEGSQVVLYPQNNLIIYRTTDKNGNKKNLNKIQVESKQGSVDIFLSKYAQENDYISLLGSGKIFSGQKIITDFEEKKRKFFVEEAGGKYLENSTINRFFEYYLNTLFMIDSERFGQKLLNFQAYQKYFNIKNEKNYNIGFTENAIDSAIKKRGASGREQTKLKTWINKLF